MFAGLTLTGNLQVDGNTTLGNAASDTLAVNATATFNTDINVTLAETENIAITNTVTGINSLDLISAVLTNNTTSSTQRGMLLQNAAGSGVTESLIALDNADADTAVTDGLIITSVAGGITDGVDVSDDDIVNALNIGSNNIVTGATTISSAELDVLDAGITLGSETNGDYVASFTAGGGLTGDASGEGSTPTLNVVSANGGIVVNANDLALTLQASGDGLSATTSSGSGLEILSGGLTLLQGCANNEILKWNETSDVWACAADTDTSSNSFATIDTPAGTDPVADSANDTLQFLASGSNITITGADNPESVTWNIDETVLAGNGLSASGDSLVVNTGNGLEIVSDNVRVDQNFSFTWTADHTWNLAGAENLDVTHDLVGTVNVLSIIGTPSATAGTAQGLFIQQADSANGNGLDAGLVIDNADTNLAIADGILISSAAGGITDDRGGR